MVPYQGPQSLESAGLYRMVILKPLTQVGDKCLH